MNYELISLSPPEHRGGLDSPADVETAIRPQAGMQPAAAKTRPKSGRNIVAVRRIIGLAGGLALMLLILIGALAGPGIAQQAVDDTRVQESRDLVLEAGPYQTERPEPPEPEQRRDPMTLPDWLIQTILVIIGAIVLAMILMFLFNLWQGRAGFRINRDQNRQTVERIDTPVSARQKAVDARTLAEADQLAAAGRFTEAIHLLLLVAMDRLKRELGTRVAPALTSREVLEEAPIPEAAVGPLTRMVSLSEIKHFGGRDAAAADYDRCRQDFLRFSGMDPAT